MNALSLGDNFIISSTQASPSINNGWVKVTKGIKADYHVESQQTLSKTSVLKKNKYFVPKQLEKKLFNTSLTKTSATITTACKGSLRCYNRNQRRKKKRAQQRVEKNTLHNMNNFIQQDDLESKENTNPQYPLSSAEDAWPDEKKSMHNMTNPIQHEGFESKHNPLGPLALAEDSWTDGILSFLAPRDIVAFGCCSKETKKLSEKGYLWKQFFKMQFPTSSLSPISQREWKLAYKLSITKTLDRLRCSHSKRTFLEDTIGIGLDFTVNPKTKRVDYISTSQDLFSLSAFIDTKNRTDVFGDKFKLFLPLYFSEDHFQRALPVIRKTIVRLCPEKKSSKFHQSMILDVLPKVINTFVVLLSDEGVAASRKSFNGMIRIHRLFLALSHEYPEIKKIAFHRLRNFATNEEHRIKSACPSLGNFLPLVMIVDEDVYQWSNIRSAYMTESFDRSVLWACKVYPELENLKGITDDARLKLTLQATSVSMRLSMLNVFFLWLLCKGSTYQRAAMYDNFCGDAETTLLSNENEKETKDSEVSNQRAATCCLSFQRFRYFIHRILSVKSWQEYYKYILAPCPKSKREMAQLLKNAVNNSRRKRYHKKGMNFSSIHASGTSKILSKGQQYSAPDTMKNLKFYDRWTFDETMYLDASCLMYEGKRLVSTLDFQNTSDSTGAVAHSGDVMTDSSGTHTITLDLQSLSSKTTALVFVLSAFAEATLDQVKSASVTFTDVDSGSELCSYHLEAHNKIPHLKSIIMCKLYRASNGGWHVLAIGDSHRGSADNYGPIIDAVKKFV